MTFNSLTEIWSYYDVKERKRFGPHDITAAINQLLEDNPDNLLCRYEALAFGFVGTNRENEWGTFYGYQFAGKREDTGEDFYSPDISLITAEILDYWERRAAKVVNPLLKMRYTGLVFDFKKRITGVQPDYKAIKLANVEAIIEVVEGDYSEYEYMALEFAFRALKLAVGFKKEELVKRVVKAYYDAYQRFGKDKYPSHIFRSLIKYRDAFAEYEDEIIKENLDRLNTLERKALEEGSRTDNYAHEMGDLVDLFCEYYHTIGEGDKIENLLDRLLVAIQKSIPLRGGMWGQGMLDRMQKRYRKYGMDKNANKLYNSISELGERTLQELHRNEFTFKLERKVIDEYLKTMMEGNHEERMLRYIFQNIPNKAAEIENYKKHAKEHPLEDLVSTIAIDSRGVAISKIGVGKNADEQKLHYYLYKKLCVGSFFMRIQMEELKRNQDVSVESLMAMFDDSPLVTDSHREFLKRGFEAYLANDHMVCCHLLIPQFEAMIRRLIDLNGGKVLKQGEDPAVGNEYISLDSLLDSEVAKMYLDEDLILYYKVLFVSEYGWNLRNQFCHGLIPASSFNSTMSDRVVHAILVLSIHKWS